MNTRLRNVLLVLGILLALAAVFAGGYFVSRMGKDTEKTPDQRSTAPISGPQDITQAPSTTGSAEEQWALRLVNSTHPMPKDYKPELAALKNGHYFDRRAVGHLQDMMDAARAEGLSPLICASYRSWEMQEDLFQNKVERCKKKGLVGEAAVEEAKKWVAYPGTGEHQVGLAVDIVSLKNQRLEEDQENTPECIWLQKNCYKYGFILRYPKDKTSITKIGYEPWHFRYVGVDAATRIMKQGVCLEEYLGQVD